MLISIICLLLNTTAFSKVDPPNYDFSLDSLQKFMPDSKIVDIDKAYKGKKELIFKQGAFVTNKYYVEHIRYKFAILVQSVNGVVTDFHARLPHYFLHDIFHQSLINRYGDQDFYKKTEESAIYIWKNEKNIKHVYSGTCTITCFPIFYAVQKVKHNFGDSYIPLLEKLFKKLTPP